MNNCTYFSAVNGGWSDWGKFSDCSVTCGMGKMTRMRSCTNPRPSNGGTACIGNEVESFGCKNVNCPGMSFLLGIF